MLKIVKIAVILFFFANIAYTQDDDGTFLSRICEYDIEKTIGLKDSGNYIIKSEFISYYFDENYKVNIVYRYIIKKLLPGKNNTFGLSIRNRTHFGGLVQDGKIDNLKVLVNEKNTRVNYKDCPYKIIDDNYNPINPDWNDEKERDKYDSEYIYNGYIGWYYFNVDFSNSDEASIEINYKTKNDIGIRYDSKPFWIPVSNDASLKIQIENKMSDVFLSYVTGCAPMDTLVTKTWRLEKPDQNTVVITYAPGWFTENKRIAIWFSSAYQPKTNPGDHYFEICTEEPYGGYGEPGVFLTANGFKGRGISNNISKRELKRYELIFLNKEQLRIMRNSFYAMYKYRFNDKILNEILYDHIFGGPIPDSWFNKNFTPALLSSMERRNIEIIQNLENMRP